MPPPNSWHLDTAVVGHLAADATLMGLLPDGVFLNEAPTKSTRFVVVRLMPGGVDDNVFGARGRETSLYLVQVIALAGTLSGVELDDAAGRMDALLDFQDITVPGFPGPASIARVGARVNETDRSDNDPSVLWYRRGAQYLLEVPSR